MAVARQIILLVAMVVFFLVQCFAAPFLDPVSNASEWTSRMNYVLTALLSPLRLSHDEILATLNTVLHQISIVCAMRVYLIHHCVDHGKHGMAKTALCALAGKHSLQLPKRNP